VITVGDLVWWDDEILALVLDLDYKSATHLSDLKPCNNQLDMV